MTELKGQLLSIGHSNHPIETFLGLLQKNKVEVLVDVRSHPYSKFSPHFDGQKLKVATTGADIKYLYLGKELGGRPDDPRFYTEDGHVLYYLLAESPAFLDGVHRLEDGAQRYKVAVLCSEEDPTSCHRRLLIGRVLASHGFALDHIRGDGRIQTEAELQEAEARQSGEDQAVLFNLQQERPWMSIQSVLQRGRRQISSGR